MTGALYVGGDGIDRLDEVRCVALEVLADLRDRKVILSTGGRTHKAWGVRLCAIHRTQNHVAIHVPSKYKPPARAQPTELS